MDFNQKELKAIRDTIIHWERDIRESLLKGLKVYIGKRGELRWEDRELVTCYANSSALCIISAADDGETDCKICPYFSYHGISCSERTSKWFKFVTTPTVATCEDMIGSLKALLLHSENSSEGRDKGSEREFKVSFKYGSVSISLN